MTMKLQFVPQDFLSAAMQLGRIKSMNVTRGKNVLKPANRLYTFISEAWLTNWFDVLLKY